MRIMRGNGSHAERLRAASRMELPSLDFYALNQLADPRSVGFGG